MSGRLTLKSLAEKQERDMANVMGLMEKIAASLGSTPTAAPAAKPRKAKAKAKKPVDPNKARVTGLFKAGKEARKAFRTALAAELGVPCDPNATVKVLIAAADTAGYDWHPIADGLIG